MPCGSYDAKPLKMQSMLGHRPPVENPRNGLGQVRQRTDVAVIAQLRRAGVPENLADLRRAAVAVSLSFRERRADDRRRGASDDRRRARGAVELRGVPLVLVARAEERSHNRT